MLALQILVVLGVGMVLYAIFGIFSPAKSDAGKKKKIEDSLLPAIDPGKEQKIQRLQNDLAQLKEELSKISAEYAQEKSALMISKENEIKLSDELKRRSEWVAKAEAELTKIKSEESDLSAKFTAKEKELQEEFTKNVNFSRDLRELKSALDEKEMACRLKEDQIQAQKHQIEEQLKSIKEHSAAINEFHRKEKISEWIPKTEFNKLNDEYSQLEKDFEASTERLKVFAEEIAHLRKEVKPVEETKREEVIRKVETPEPKEETKPVEEVKPAEEIKQEEAVPVEEKLEKPAEENIEKPVEPKTE